MMNEYDKLPRLIAGDSSNDEQITADLTRARFFRASRGRARELYHVRQVHEWIYFARFGIFKKDVR